MVFKLAIFAICALLFTQTSARIPSFGLETFQAARSSFEASDFLINFNQVTPGMGPNFTVEAADLTSFPTLGAQDVQFFFARLSLKSGSSFIDHYHPRATETIIVLRGVFRITIVDEGLTGGRRLTNRVRVGEILAIPQGLIHESACISKRDCVFVAQFNSADPGIIGV